MEAVWRIDVVDFPAFIVVDDKGNDFFDEIANAVGGVPVRAAEIARRSGNRNGPKGRRWHVAQTPSDAPRYCAVADSMEVLSDILNSMRVAGSRLLL